MVKGITSRQQMVLNYLADYLERRGFPPTLREIAAYLEITSLKAVERHLKALEKKGYLQRTGGISRAIELVGRSLSPQVRQVPIVGTVRAGGPELALEDLEGQLAFDSSLVRWADAFFLRVKGESMIEAHIQDGDLALIRPQPGAENGEIVVAMIDNEATLKYFYRENGMVRLQPANSKMKPIVLREGDGELVIIGKMVGLFREEGTFLPHRGRVFE